MKGHEKKIVEVKKKEPTSDELLADIIGQPEVNGFRKGMTKKKLVKSLTEEDWLSIDKLKQAEDRKLNETAYQLFVLGDQLRQEFEKAKIELDENLASAFQYKEIMLRNDVDIKLGSTKQTDADGDKFSIEDLRTQNVKFDAKIRRFKSLIIANLNELYTYIGRLGLDKEPFFTEEDYDKIAKQAIEKFKATGHDLLK